MTDPDRQSLQLPDIFLRLLLAFSLWLASLLLLSTIPYFPDSLCVVIAFALAAVSYKYPIAAMFLMFLVSMPGYIYQGGFPPLMVGIIGGVLLFVVVACEERPGAVLGVVAGVIAAMLMFTSVYYIAVPLFIGVTLFRTRGIRVGSTGAILVFMIFFLPFLVAQNPIPDSEPAPLFEQVHFSEKSRIDIVELDSMFTHLDDSFDTNEHIVDNIELYWPIGGDSRLIGFVLLFCLSAAIATAFACFALFSAFKRRGHWHDYLDWGAPIIALLIADLIFLLPLITLEEAFDYSTDLGPGTLFGFIASTIVIGAIGAGTENWMYRRERLLDLRQRYQARIPGITQLIAQVQEQIAFLKKLSPRLDLFAETALVEKCHQELDFTADTLETLDTFTLKEKLNRLNLFESELTGVSETATHRLLRSVDEGRQEYMLASSQASEYGLSLGENPYETNSHRSSAADYDSLVDEQVRLNQAFGDLAESLVASGIQITHTIKQEVDPEFVAISIEIARNYLEAGNPQEAVDASLAALTTMDHMVADAALGITERLDDARKNLVQAIESFVIPAVDSVGDAEMAGDLDAHMVKIKGLESAVRSGKRLVDLLEIVRIARELSNWTAVIGTQLAAKISDLEREIDSRLPSGYHWDKSELILSQVDDTLKKLNGKSRRSSLKVNMAAVETAIKNIEQEAVIIRHYTAMREFAINYPNIEYLLEEKLQANGLARVEDLPVRAVYSVRYLRLYAHKHFRQVSFDSRTQTLTYREDYQESAVMKT